MHHSRLFASMLVTVVLVLPVQAAFAAEVKLDRGCYSPGDPVMQTGSGFTPGGQVVESLALLDSKTGEVLLQGFTDPVSVDGQGAFSRQLSAPRLARRRDRRELAMSAFADQDDSDKSAFVQWILSDWSIVIRAWGRGRGRARGTMVVDTYGWTSAGTSLFAHYFRRGKLLRSVRIGALQGPCGDLRKRVRQFPFRARPGTWTVLFSATRKFDRDEPYLGYRVRLPR